MRQVITDPEEIAQTFYSGCYVHAIINFWVQDNKNGKALRASCGGVMFYKDGDRFSGAAIAKAEDFGEIEVEGLFCALLQSDELCVEGFRVYTLAKLVQAMVGGKRRNIVALFVGCGKGEFHEFARLNLGVGVGILEVVVVVTEFFDLSVDFFVSGLGGGNLYLNGLIAGKLVLGLDLNGSGEVEGLMVFNKIELVLIVRTLQRHDVVLFECLRIYLVDKILGNGGAYCISAHDVVDNGTRSLARAEAREAVALGNLTIRTLDACVYIVSVDLEAELHLVVLESLYFDVHE